MKFFLCLFVCFFVSFLDFFCRIFLLFFGFVLFFFFKFLIILNWNIKHWIKWIWINVNSFGADDRFAGFRRCGWADVMFRLGRGRSTIEIERMPHGPRWCYWFTDFSFFILLIFYFFFFFFIIINVFIFFIIISFTIVPFIISIISISVIFLIIIFIVFFYLIQHQHKKLGFLHRRLVFVTSFLFKFFFPLLILFVIDFDLFSSIVVKRFTGCNWKVLRQQYGMRMLRRQRMRRSIGRLTRLISKSSILVLFLSVP